MYECMVKIRGKKKIVLRICFVKGEDLLNEVHHNSLLRTRYSSIQSLALAGIAIGRLPIIDKRIL